MPVTLFVAMSEHLEDSDVFSVVMPTYQGGRFYRRTFDYLRSIDYRGRLVVCDDSAGEHRVFIDACRSAYPELWIELFSYPHPTPFLDKLIDTLGRLDSRQVMLHAQDDFMIMEAVGACVDLLESRPDYTAARGRVAMLQLERNANGDVDTYVIPHGMREYVEEDPTARLFSHLKEYASTFYSVHRRASLLTALGYTRERNDNVIFFQYLSSAMVALQGKIACIDDLFYCRQGHAGSWSATLRDHSYEHWPLLITNPGFSALYAKFRMALIDWISDRTSARPADFEMQLDRACVELFQRSFCGSGTEYVTTEYAGEGSFQQQLGQDGTKARQGMLRVIDFIRAYPDTYP